jgi:hypothetical protein
MTAVTGPETAAIIASNVLDEFVTSITDASNAADSLSDSLSNIPTGYLLTLAEFNAARTGAGYGAAPGAGGVSPQSMGGITITGPITVQADDPAELHRALQKEANFESFRTTGQSVRGTDYAGASATR